MSKEGVDDGLAHAAVTEDHDVVGELLDHGQVPSNTDHAADVGIEHGARELGGDDEDDADTAEGAKV